MRLLRLAASAAFFSLAFAAAEATPAPSESDCNAYYPGTATPASSPSPDMPAVTAAAGGSDASVEKKRIQENKIKERKRNAAALNGHIPAAHAVVVRSASSPAMVTAVRSNKTVEIAPGQYTTLAAHAPPFANARNATHPSIWTTLVVTNTLTVPGTTNGTALPASRALTTATQTLTLPVPATAHNGSHGLRTARFAPVTLIMHVATTLLGTSSTWIPAPGATAASNTTTVVPVATTVLITKTSTSTGTRSIAPMIYLTTIVAPQATTVLRTSTVVLGGNATAMGSYSTSVFPVATTTVLSTKVVGGDGALVGTVGASASAGLANLSGADVNATRFSAPTAPSARLAGVSSGAAPALMVVPWALVAALVAIPLAL